MDNVKKLEYLLTIVEKENTQLRTEKQNLLSRILNLNEIQKGLEKKVREAINTTTNVEFDLSVKIDILKTRNEKLEECKEILKEFATTKVESRTWLHEMRGTIEDVLIELGE